LLNLISNTIDSILEKWGRVLSIGTEMQHAGRVMVPVEDSGKGLDPGAADRLFSPA